VVPLAFRVLDDADNAHLRRQLFGGEHDTRVDLVGDIRHQRPRVGQVRGRQPLRRLRIRADHCPARLVETHRPVGVRFDDRVGDLVGVELLDERRRPRGVRTDDDVAGQVLIQRPGTVVEKASSREGVTTDRQRADQKHHADEVHHRDERV